MHTRARLTVVTGPTSRPTFQEEVARFLRHAEAKGLSPATVRFYQQRLDSFATRTGLTHLHALTPDLARSYLAQEREATSPATARHGWSALSAFCAFLLAEGVLDANPMEGVARPRIPVKVVKPLSEGEVEALLSQGSPRTFCGTRLRALVLLLVDCGLRASEVVGLNEGDVDWNEGTLTVMGKGAKERTVPFGQATRAALLSYQTRRGELPGEKALFVAAYGTRLRRDDLHDIIRRAGEQAGLSGLHPHKLRHTCAVMFLRNGGDAFSLQKLLGHSSLDMTRRYAELAQSDVVAKHRAASPGDRFLSQVQKGGGRKRLR